MITVVFATRNGSRTLPAVLEEYCRIESPEGGWKLIVVDNASTDGSFGIARRYAERLPLLCLEEKELGKNAALNAAIPHFDGDLIAFTDDDVFPSRDWLVSLKDAADAHPDCAVFGGVILPRWEVPAPDWVLEWVPGDVIFALTNPSLPDGPATPDQIFGPNMAVRADVFRKGFRFDNAIGPRGENYAMGSETEFVRRLARHGFAARHVRSARVEHFIRGYQMEKAWILGRAIRYGRGQYRLKNARKPYEGVTWLGIPRYMVRQYLGQVAKIARCLAAPGGEKMFRERWELNYLYGNMLEARSLHRGK